MVDKKLERNVDLMISAEFLKQLYDELITAGFERDVAIEYMAAIVSRFYKKKDKK